MELSMIDRCQGRWESGGKMNRKGWQDEKITDWDKTSTIVIALRI